ncbi:MAG: hypothetical protein ACRC46_02965 [Thermoguttaceae bacterium]
MRNRVVMVTCGLMFVVLVAMGCGEKRPDGMPPLFKASITLKQNGQPAPDVCVTLYNEDGSPTKWVIGGYTDAQGRLALATHGKYLGVPKATYKVVVSKQEYVGAPVLKPDANEAEIQAFNEKMATVKPTETMPAETAKPETTTLLLKVTKAGDSAEFDVSKK